MEEEKSSCVFYLFLFLFRYLMLLLLESNLNVEQIWLCGMEDGYELLPLSGFLSLRSRLGSCTDHFI